ncbi:MAG: hypothetical protein QXV22_00910 [Thermoplasmataceae archaeon]
MTERYANMGTGHVASILCVVVPVLAGIISVALRNLLVMDYVHVLLGAIWTGTDIFLGLIFTNVLRNVNNGIQQRVMKRLLPMTLFFIPTASVVTPAVGYFLASYEGIFSLSNSIFIAIVVVGLFLVSITFAVIMPYSIIIAIKSKVPEIDSPIQRYVRGVTAGCFVQMLFQIGIISLMAYIVVFY